MKEIEGSSVVLLGYGREGRSTHRYLLTHYPDKEIGIADQNEVEPLSGTKVEIHTGERYLEDLENYDVIVRSPGIPLRLPQLQGYIEEGKKVTSATNIFLAECPGMIIGVTGTKGKSTTSTLIARILEKNYPDVKLVGNIGLPALDYLDGATENSLFVTELSSQQLEDTRYSPHIAVILSIVPEHLNHHGNFKNYVQSKRNIVRYQNQNDIVVFNPNHKITTTLARDSSARKFLFSLEKAKNIDCYLDGENIFVNQGGETQFVMSSKEIPLLGMGNVENTLAAISVSILLGVPLTKIREAIMEFTPLPHRLEFVGEKKGIQFYNDSLSTIPQATIHAIEALGSNVETLIAGGYNRGINFSELGKFLVHRKLKTLILFPPTGERIWQAICNATPEEDLRPEKYEASSMQEAVSLAFDHTSPGKICLMSPASASFGLFRNYEERGELFKKFVLEFQNS